MPGRATAFSYGESVILIPERVCRPVTMFFCFSKVFARRRYRVTGKYDQILNYVVSDRRDLFGLTGDS